jgi:hypothetical protein
MPSLTVYAPRAARPQPSRNRGCAVVVALILAACGGSGSSDTEHAEDVREDATPEPVAHSDSFRLFEPAPAQGIRRPLHIEGEARVESGRFTIELEDGHDLLARRDMVVEAAPAWGSFSVELDYEVPSSPGGTLLFIYEAPRDGARVEELVVPLEFLDRPLADAP